MIPGSWRQYCQNDLPQSNCAKPQTPACLDCLSHTANWFEVFIVLPVRGDFNPKNSQYQTTTAAGLAKNRFIR